jgi:hypothetical protein
MFIKSKILVQFLAVYHNFAATIPYNTRATAVFLLPVPIPRFLITLLPLA